MNIYYCKSQFVFNKLQSWICLISSFNYMMLRDVNECEIMSAGAHKYSLLEEFKQFHNKYTCIYGGFCFGKLHVELKVTQMASGFRTLDADYVFSQQKTYRTFSLRYTCLLNSYIMTYILIYFATCIIICFLVIFICTIWWDEIIYVLICTKFLASKRHGFLKLLNPCMTEKTLVNLVGNWYLLMEITSFR